MARIRLLQHVRLRIVRGGSVVLMSLLFLWGVALPIAAHTPAVPSVAVNSIAQVPLNAETLTQQGRQLYDTNQFVQAIPVWQQAVEAFVTAGDRAGQGMALSNLSLSYQQLGRWTEAETAIRDAIALLHASLTVPEHTHLLAQAWDVLGRLQLERGQAEAALTSWQQSAALYQSQDATIPLVRNQINQAQALQALGLYRQAREALTAANQVLQSQPESPLQAIGLQSLGNVLRVIGDLDESRLLLQQSLAVAQAIADPQITSETLLSLGNTARAQQDRQAALEFYQQAATTAPSPMARMAAQLPQLGLLIDAGQWDAAQPLYIQITTQLASQPASRNGIYARIELVQRLLPLFSQAVDHLPPPTDLATLLTTALQHARDLGDRRAESYSLGMLGHLYEQTQQWVEAQTLTQQALALAQGINASDIAYQWQWQLGRILRAQDQRSEAIAAYKEAINTLQNLRDDLVAVNPDVQFSFRDQVEPVYRQLVDLLLQGQADAASSQENLQNARDTIDFLQLAQLDNFLREACLDPTFRLDAVVDQTDPTAAVFYAILLSDRVEVVVKLPGQPLLHHYATAIAQADAEQILSDLRASLVDPTRQRQGRSLSQEVYNWLIQPIALELAQHEIKTLVFVLDGTLRSVPMAALYDGQRYLIEQYSIALSPGLQLTEPQPLSQNKLKALVGGLTESRLGFSPLPYVATEVQQIESELVGEILLNQQFTTQTFQDEINSQSFPIVHLATHGQFSSDASQTFILAWDKRINVNELDTVLRQRDQTQAVPLELLVLSACETATGDNRAVLGLAGVALRAGARSTLASLWRVNDRSTSELMTVFYQHLASGVPRAEALRQAQLSLLTNPQYQRPSFWAAYVLVGSWL